MCVYTDASVCPPFIVEYNTLTVHEAEGMLCGRRSSQDCHAPGDPRAGPPGSPIVLAHGPRPASGHTISSLFLVLYDLNMYP